MQTTNKVFMIEPVRFGYNEQTAVNNEFVVKSASGNIQELALKEFNAYTDLLKANGVNVVTVSDTKMPHTPDSIFPNNWFSTHEGGKLVLYPMFAENRRAERKKTFIDAIEKNFNVNRLIDLSVYEKEGLFLEGTGSMVLDRDSHIAYACRSPRTSEKLLSKFCDELSYTPCIFDAVGSNGHQIYHTNILMSIGTDFAVVCLDTIRDNAQRDILIRSLEGSGKHIIEIAYAQLEQYAGNMLEIKNADGERLLALSAAAKKALSPAQLAQLSARCKIISPELSIIEHNGGGSARCMLAELF